MAESQLKEFDPTPWLRRPALELVEIFALMRGQDPTYSKGIGSMQAPLLRALKIAIDGGELPAGRLENERAFLRSYIRYGDLGGFISPRKDDLVWSSENSETNLWKFYQRWAEVRGVELPRFRGRLWIWASGG